MIFVPVIAAIIFAIAFTPSSSRGGRCSGYRRKSKGLVATLLDGQAKTEKRNNSHRGAFCGPGGIGHRGGKRR